MAAKSFGTRQNYLSELTVIEHVILGVNVGCSLIFFIVQLCMGQGNDVSTGLSFIASVISIFAVMAGAKKRILCPFLGIIASIFLIALAGIQGVYGSMIMYGLNILMQIGSFVSGYRSSKNKVSITPKAIKGGIALIYLLTFAGLTALFTGVESLEGFVWFGSGHQTKEIQILAIRIFDSANLMFTIACFFPMIKRYNQVGYTYILSDLAICLLGLSKSIVDPTVFSNWTMFVSGLCMTVTCFLGLYNGKKSTKDPNFA